MYQREALWLGFDAAWWKPNAVKIGIGGVNAISGRAWDLALHDNPQDYLVCPQQPWLDGINAGEGIIRQFVAMPLGMGYTVEGQVTGKEEFGGLQILVFEPKPGRFPEGAERVRFERVCACLRPCAEMGLGAGGRMRQLIYPDDYGIDTWDRTNTGRVYVHIVNSMAYREITGEEPPATPVSAKTYAQFGLPWFDLYDEGKKDVAASDVLKGIKSVKEMDQEKGFGPQQDDSSVEVPPDNVKKIPAPAQVEKEGLPVSDGSW